MGYRRKDHYYRKAKEEGYLSRAAYKFREINQKVRIVSPGDRVVDVGCAPGGWSQVLLKVVGRNGFVVGIDILPACRVRGENFAFLHMDVEDPECPEKVLSLTRGPVDAVVSDAAPNTTGVKHVDHARSVALVDAVLTFAIRVLREGGNFLAKVFDGPETKELEGKMRKKFRKVRRIRPGATRKESFEVYLTGIGFVGGGSEGEGERD